MRSRWLTLVLALALGVPALGGCGALSGSSCVPRISVEPSHASPGDTITVKSADKCDVKVPQGGWVIGAGHVGGGVESLVERDDRPNVRWLVLGATHAPRELPCGRILRGRHELGLLEL